MNNIIAKKIMLRYKDNPQNETIRDYLLDLVIIPQHYQYTFWV